MTATLPPVVGRLVGDSTDYVRSLKDAESQTEKTTKSASKNFGSMASNLTKVVGTGALLTFAKNARDMSSDVAEAGSKVGVVFGQARADVDAFAESSARSFGISKREALSAAGTFGNLFVATGLAQDAASSMSVDVVKLAADLGSFNNLGTDEVLEKLRSGLVGEVEPLRALGINFDAAAVKAKAMEMGLADANGEVGQGALVQARYALILEQTKTAQGDFARTADGMANSSKIAAAAAEDQSAKFGDALAPAMAKVNKLAAAALNLFNGLPDPIQQVTIGLGMATAAVTLLGGRTAAWTAITKLAAAAQLAFNFVLSANPIGLVVIALAVLAAGLYFAYQKSETFREAVGALGRFFIAMKDNAIDAIASLVDTWLGAVEWIVKGGAKMFGWLPFGVGDKLKEAAGWIEGFRDDANHFLDGIRDKEVNVNLNTDAFWAEWNRVASATRVVTAVEFQAPGVDTAGPQRYHDGGIVGGHGEVGILAQAGEGVFTKGQMRALGLAMGSLGGSGAGGAGGNTYILQISTATGDIPDSTIRKIQAKFYEMSLDRPSVLPA